jgi:hypothetical protein
LASAKTIYEEVAKFDWNQDRAIRVTQSPFLPEKALYQGFSMMSNKRHRR